MKKIFKKFHYLLGILFMFLAMNSELMAGFSLRKQGKGVFVFNLIIVAVGAALGYLIWRKRSGSQVTKMKKMIFFTTFSLLMIGSSLYSQSLNLTPAASSVKSALNSTAGIIGGLVGLLGIGRAAIKFSQGEHDAVMSLLSGMIAVVLGQVASGLV